ncbi:TetR/AcrR family transcriptional regulator [Rhizobium sp. C4]|uniref:TetR/AcrR family transcriptional regulator n=1 Tax=Rhizobium sp. C4 TaxID=1349800 RepID=UPI001E2E8D39|nr:TetR/AcrR family transcriptional regulator [Rhizobium sp. C4]MCD2172998.1 TetR/AcrR family transcriptional regulator [Rhizobium sp. C4]
MSVKDDGGEARMRYQDGYKDQKRRDLLKAAGAAAKKKGFAATGVDALAEAAGVTSGAVYAHFGSKAGLLDAVIVNEMERSRARWGKNPDRPADVWLTDELARYLSRAHIDNPESGCLMPTLAADVARAPGATRRVFEEQLKQVQAEIAERLGDGEKAWQFLSQIVGAMVLARAVMSADMQEEILAVSRKVMTG